MSFHEESASTSSSAPKIDGRRLRSERTRLAIIEAYQELLRRNSVMPTAVQIAEQAGCSVRSVFERFSDLDALSLATADFAIAQGQAEHVLVARLEVPAHLRLVEAVWLQVARLLGHQLTGLQAGDGVDEVLQFSVFGRGLQRVGQRRRR